MTHILFGQNKFIATFTLQQKLTELKKKDQFLKPIPFVIMISHFQYPCIFYQKLYQNFKSFAPSQKKYTKDNIRIKFKGKQISSDFPIGLYIPEGNETYFQFQVTFSDHPFMDSFRVIKNAWKKSFQIVNFNRRNDYVKSRLSLNQLMVKYKLYTDGLSTNLHNEGLYQGTHIFLRGFYQGDVVERKFQAKKEKNIIDLIPQLFPQIFDEDNQIQKKYKGVKFYSHGLELSRQMNINVKQFLDLWNYNDGFCYVKIVLKKNND